MPNFCPHCNANIDRLRLEHIRTQHQTYLLNEERTTSDEPPTYSDIYICPECDSITQLNNIIHRPEVISNNNKLINEDGNLVSKEEITRIRQLLEEAHRNMQSFEAQEFRPMRSSVTPGKKSNKLSLLKCEHCGYENEIDEEEISLTCKCGQEIVFKHDNFITKTLF